MMSGLGSGHHPGPGRPGCPEAPERVEVYEDPGQGSHPAGNTAGGGGGGGAAAGVWWLCRSLRHAPGVGQGGGLEVLGVPESVESSQVTAETVADQVDLVQAQTGPPGLQTAHVLLLYQGRLGGETHPAAAAEPGEVEGEDGPAGRQPGVVEEEEGEAGSHTVDQDQGHCSSSSGGARPKLPRPDTTLLAVDLPGRDVEPGGLDVGEGEEVLLGLLQLLGAGGSPAEPGQPGLEPAQSGLQHGNLGHPRSLSLSHCLTVSLTQVTTQIFQNSLHCT